MGSIRERLEAEERGRLAPYAMASADSRGRAAPEPEHPYRTRFQRDRDRIVHATAFRRLEHKTQVLLNAHGDHYRTRLTHTLEAAQIARTLGRGLGLNEDLIEAVALAHDLGHAPFGHAGGEALDGCLREHGGFEHNRQSLRVVELLERRHPEVRGLNLTYEVQESVIKHGLEEDRRPPELERYRPEEGPLLEAQVVDVADGLAYLAHDCDDAVRFGLLTPEELCASALWRRAQQAAAQRHGTLGERDLAVKAAVRRLLDLAVTDVLETTRARLAERGIDSVAAVRASRGYLVGPSAALAAELAELKAFLFERYYRHWRVMRMVRKAQQVVVRLFEAFVAEPRTLPQRWQAWCEQAGRERAVADYIAGMTDRYAQREYRRLFEPFALP
ncbi:MAG: deoxyguanosinetriphosphate triphosphohydrolase-like protein [Planctomycetota bacterium]|nr:MAG: deoxyguanosinetriphosphate triphosphohydrolase-like protein [Planctomycetota bacterium]